MPVTRLGKCTWGWPEVRALLSGSFVGAHAARRALAAALRGLGYPPSPLLVSRASVGLRLALEEMRAQEPKRSIVVVPSYCCPSVPVTVRELGLTLRAAPVGPDLNLDLDRAAPLIDERVLAVVGVHMYALPLDIKRLNVVATAAGAFVVDDAAHMVGGLPGEPLLGVEGDVGILSFNQSKTLTGGAPRGGGALYVTNARLREGLDRRFAALDEGKARARTYIWFALRYGIEITPRALTEYIGDLDYPLIWALAVDAKGAERMNPGAASVVRAQVGRLTRILEGRTAVVGWYRDRLRAIGRIELVQTEGPRYLSRVLVRWRGGTDALAVRERLARRGFAARMPYPMWTANDDPTAPSIREVRATHLELPGSPRLTQRQVDEVGAALTQCLDS